ncbi:hypothetical protein HK405_012777, partial [Cladochytrium tenue]
DSEATFSSDPPQSTLTPAAVHSERLTDLRAAVAEARSVAAQRALQLRRQRRGPPRALTAARADAAALHAAADRAAAADARLVVRAADLADDVSAATKSLDARRADVAEIERGAAAAVVRLNDLRRLLADLRGGDGRTRGGARRAVTDVSRPAAATAPAPDAVWRTLHDRAKALTRDARSVDAARAVLLATDTPRLAATLDRAHSALSAARAAAVAAQRALQLRRQRRGPPRALTAA